jgi:hypothetical protein
MKNRGVLKRFTSGLAAAIKLAAKMQPVSLGWAGRARLPTLRDCPPRRAPNAPCHPGLTHCHRIIGLAGLSNEENREMAFGGGIGGGGGVAVF